MTFDRNYSRQLAEERDAAREGSLDYPPQHYEPTAEEKLAEIQSRKERPMQLTIEYEQDGGQRFAKTKINGKYMHACGSDWEHARHRLLEKVRKALNLATEGVPEPEVVEV